MFITGNLLISFLNLYAAYNNQIEVIPYLVYKKRIFSVVAYMLN